MYKGSLSNSFLIPFLNFSQISLQFSLYFSFYQKRYLFSFIKVSSICTHFWEKCTYRSSFLAFLSNEIFKFFFTKTDLALLDASILLISTFFIAIGFSCWWNLFFSISELPNFRIVFPLLYILSKMFVFFSFTIFYFFSLKLEFQLNLQVQNFSIMYVFNIFPYHYSGKNDFIDLLQNSLLLSTHILFGLQFDLSEFFWKPLVIVTAILSFK